MTPQQTVVRFISAHDLTASPQARLLDLVSEVGELAKELLRGSDYGRAPLTLPATWAEELGDVYFALLCLAESTGVDLEAALEGVLVKYAARLEQTGQAGSMKNSQGFTRN